MRIPFDISFVYWTALLLVFFLPRELAGAVLTPKRRDTFSEFCWWAFDERWERVTLAAFLAFLTMHLVWRWSVVPILVLGAMVGYIILKAMKEATMAKYSPKKGALKFGANILDIVIAILVAAIPQIVEVLIAVTANTDPAQLKIPAEWATAWFLIIKVFRNWWKNRK